MYATNERAAQSVFIELTANYALYKARKRTVGDKIIGSCGFCAYKVKSENETTVKFNLS